MQIPLQSNYREILQPILGNASPHIRNTAEKNMTNILTLVPVGMDVGFDDRLEVLLC